MKISVVIPYHNAERTIVRTLDSVNEQTFPAYEVLLVDDGSSAQSSSFLRDAGLPDSLRVIRTPNRGVAHARNTGAAASRGDLLAFLDSDDVWHPEYLGTLSNRFANDDVGLVFSRLEWIDDNDRSLGVVNRRIPVPTLARLLTGNFVGSGSNFIVRRDCFEALGGFSEELLAAEDYHFALKFFIDARWQGIQVPDVLVGYRRAPGTASRKLELMRQGLLQVRRSIAADLKPVDNLLLFLGVERIWLSLLLARHRARRNARGGDFTASRHK